jgi:energy-coupling factor transporter ATP-binding protein EcfA2
VLKIEDLGFSFPNGQPIFEHLTFNLKKGESLAVLGESGAGKTTLAYLIKRIIPILMKGTIRGSIFFHDKPLKKYSFVELNKRIGMMMPNPESYMFTQSVYEEVMFAVRNYGLPKTNVEDVLNYLGISALRDRPPQNLSSGQKQLVSLAMVLATRPEIIILDEPNLHLDMKSEEKLISIIKKLKADECISFIIIGHDANFAVQIADKALYLGGQGYKFGDITEFTEQTQQITWKKEFYR